MFRLLKMFWFLKPTKGTILWRGSSGTAVTMQQLGTSWRKKKTFRNQKRIWKGPWVELKSNSTFSSIWSLFVDGNFSSLISCNRTEFISNYNLLSNCSRKINEKCNLTQPNQIIMQGMKKCNEEMKNVKNITDSKSRKLLEFLIIIILSRMPNS